MNLVVDGHSFNKEQSVYLMGLIAKATNLNTPYDVQKYLKDFKVEERSSGYPELDDAFILRNPNGYGPNFSVRKL
ncbi:hypothetical protein P9D54_13205 [Bacillus haynesii]|uniref:hypothetical protein n=1 Tax=Bacillus haynesii TaxID=1925021 RepID=UPI0015936470|nr:hypothetical protein [Bacillus haynesii]NVB36106.1 hypothetical protein [Bacillus licheniformis]MCY8663691.1 hypothetical protein [Bacillus haynesii]MEC0719715.1 hypothetical protein [Bacillus haynesii]MEC1346322.1 hypothetical protein [Bacillus haynesii]MEC1470477.1 hypothetical protein [Bacillus haynesii]